MKSTDCIRPTTTSSLLPTALLATLLALEAGSLASAADNSSFLATIAPAKISGFLDASAIWQISGEPVATGRWLDGPDRQNDFNFNAAFLYLDKPVPEGDWTLGYKIVLMGGPDAELSTGGDIGIHNAFLRVHTPIGNGLDFKVGVWSSISGFEYLESYKNPNYSHSFGFSSIEPGRQTGVQANYKVNNVLSVVLGVSTAYTAGIGAVPFKYKDGVLERDHGALTYMGGITLTAPESMGWLKGTELYATVIRGKTAPRVGHARYEGEYVTNYYAGLTIPTPLKQLSFVLTYDRSEYERIAAPGAFNYVAPSNAEAYALYTVYKATDKLTLAHRIDYGTGTQGFFGGYTSALRPRGPGDDRLLSNTLTASYDLTANVICRLEARWDSDLDTHGGAGYFGHGDTSASSLALSVIFKF